MTKLKSLGENGKCHSLVNLKAVDERQPVPKTAFRTRVCSPSGVDRAGRLRLAVPAAPAGGGSGRRDRWRGGGTGGGGRSTRASGRLPAATRFPSTYLG